MIERLRVMLIRIETFVLVNFFCSFVNGNGYFNDAISLLWFISYMNKKPYVLQSLTPFSS
jgi:hypothetical protein